MTVALLHTLATSELGKLEREGTNYCPCSHLCYFPFCNGRRTAYRTLHGLLPATFSISAIPSSHECCEPVPVLAFYPWSGKSQLCWLSWAAQRDTVRCPEVQCSWVHSAKHQAWAGHVLVPSLMTNANLILQQPRKVHIVSDWSFLEVLLHC